MIYEFLYRGHTAQNDMKGAWHVILGQYVDAFGEQQLQTKGPLTPSQAEALGFPLATILNEVAAEAIKRGDAAFQAETEAKEKQQAAEDEKAKALAEKDAAIKERDEARSFSLDVQKQAKEIIAEKEKQLKQLSLHAFVLEQQVNMKQEPK